MKLKMALMTEDTEDALMTEDFIEDQVKTIDRLLLNAYGTVYKLIAKNVAYRNRLCPPHEREEMLIAKNLISNLWSVLEYCCIVLRWHFNKGELKSLILSKNNHFPCNFKADIREEKGKKEWEKEHLKKMILRKSISDDEYKDFKASFGDALSHVQHTWPTHGERTKVEVKEKWKTFYWLHFLRNTIAHSNMQIKGRDERKKIAALDPEKNKHSKCQGITTVLAVTIRVPTTPWNTSESTKQIPLLDFLFDACRLVKKCRNKILTKMGYETFKNSYGFILNETTKNRATELNITVLLLNEPTPPVPVYYTHLNCYGIEQDLEEEERRRRYALFSEEIIQP